MIIRESPVSKKNEPETNWPPRSPHEALLASPSRLKRLQQARRNDTSPTPNKRRRLDEASIENEEAETDIDDDDDDEEALKLQLKEIEIRRKLKKIQDAKKKKATLSRGRSESDQEREPIAVEVGHSPKQNRTTHQQLPASPSRIQLGIDKGVKAADVSLKKARPAKSAVSEFNGRQPTAKPKSFSQRLADLKNNDLQKDEKQRSREAARSKGFGIPKPVTAPEPISKPIRPQTTNKAVFIVPPQAGKHDERLSVAHEKYRAAVEQTGFVEPQTGFSLSKQTLDSTTLSEALKGKTVVSIQQLLKDVTSPDYDLPDFPTEDFVVTGIIASKSTPRDQQKSTSLKGTKDDEKADAPVPKFMAVTLTDLKWSIDLFLFDTGFSRFWKLTVGTAIAILNPGIMPPKPNMRDTGRFSLKLSSSEDTVVEIGMSSDLGFCSSTKKDGKQCGQWIDKRKTEFCDFHVNLAIEKTTSKRMEINGMSAMGLFGASGAAGVKGSQGGGTGPGSKWRRGGANKSSKREGEYYDRSLGEKAYIVPAEFASSKNTAKLLDAEDYVQGALSSKERSRKRLADREKERELSRQLAQAGGGMGSEYMRVKGRPAGSVEDGKPQRGGVVDVQEEKKDAAELGLVGASAAGVTLSPVRGRRRRSNEGAQPMGWSGAFKRDMLSPSRKMVSARRHDGAQGEALTAAVVSTTVSAGPAEKHEVVAISRATTFDDDDDDGLDIV